MPLLLQEVRNMLLVTTFTGIPNFFSISKIYNNEYYLYSAYDCEIPPMGKIIAKTDIQIQLPEGCYGRVAPRSGLAANHHIDIGGRQLNDMWL